MKVPAEYILATAEQSQHVDAETINEFGIGSFTLMEVAGSSAAKMLLDELEPQSHGLFLCGKGNNGGDAQVVARYLAQHDFKITLVFISGTDDLSPDAEKNYRLLQSVTQNDEAASVNFVDGWDNFNSSIDADFIVDGMLGTGLDSELRGDYNKAVHWTNKSGLPVYAMDIPTGLHADTGQVMGNAIAADATFAFGMRKQGFYLGEGQKHTGTVYFCELPFPQYLRRKSSTYLIHENWVPKPSSKPARHKYEAGVAYIIAGSEGLTGAAIMAAKSAWAEGIGAVILICPRGVVSVFENTLPQIIKKPVGDREDVYFQKNHLKEVRSIVAEKEGSILLGPGLGRDESTAAFAADFLSATEQDLIIDADGLWALAQQNNWQKPAKASWILTPHPGELSRLLSASPETDAQRLTEVRKTSQYKDITILSKGYPVIIGTPAGKTYLTHYDTRIFSRAGFGDILAGKIAAYKAMGYLQDESCIHALLNGKRKAESMQNSNHHLEPLDLV